MSFGDLKTKLATLLKPFRSSMELLEEIFVVCIIFLLMYLMFSSTDSRK